MTNNYPTMEAMTGNIHYVLTCGTQTQIRDGLNWYERANAFCQDLSDHYRQPLSVVASVVSALSPRCQWPQNQRDAIALLDAFTTGRHYLSADMFSSERERELAHRILSFADPDMLSGQKRVDFRHSIALAGQYDRCAVDTHTIQIAWNRPSKGMGSVKLSALQYQRIVDAYAYVAALWGYSTANTQAVSWVIKREGI